MFGVYGTTYGAGDGSTTFQLPDFRNRTIWGANSAGYLAAGLPNITGEVGSVGEYKGRSKVSGAFKRGSLVFGFGGGDTVSAYNTTFNASLSNSIYNNTNTVQPPSIKVRVYTRYQ